jgi:hypothetical protein
MICCLVPKEVVLTNGCPYLVPFEDHDLNLGILGILSSRIFDWWCRRFVEGTMRQTILNAAPFPELADDDLTSLASVSRDLLAASATARGHLEAKLDAIVSRLYGLDRDDLKVIFETFHKTWEPTSHYEQVVALLEETETINVR